MAVETAFVQDTRAQQILVDPELYAQQAHEGARLDVERRHVEERQRREA